MLEKAYFSGEKQMDAWVRRINIQGTKRGVHTVSLRARMHMQRHKLAIACEWSAGAFACAEVHANSSTHSGLAKAGEAV